MTGFLSISGRRMVVGAALVFLLSGCRGGTAPPTDLTHHLSVVFGGDGSGEVSQDGGGISCADTCSTDVDSGTTLTLRATPAQGSAFVSWQGCDGVSGADCALTVDGDRTVSVTFARPQGSGSLQVAFDGLPGPWTEAGYATLQTPGGDRIPVFESGVIGDLPSGHYTFTVEPLPICGVDYVPSSGTLDVSIEPGGVASVGPSYSPAVVPLGFRARVTGIHSNAGPIELFATVVSEELHLRTFACARFRENGHVSMARILAGNAKNFFVETAPVVLALEPNSDSCLADVDAGDDTCTIYFDGGATLTPAVAQELAAGQYYVHVATLLATHGHLVAQILPDDGETGTGIGGALAITVDGTEVPEALIGSFDVCVGGVFYLDRDDEDVCRDEGSVLLDDLLSDTYVARIEPRDGTDIPGLTITGSPAIVRPGELRTIRVGYVAPE